MCVLHQYWNRLYFPSSTCFHKDKYYVQCKFRFSLCDYEYHPVFTINTNKTMSKDLKIYFPSWMRWRPFQSLHFFSNLPKSPVCFKVLSDCCHLECNVYFLNIFLSCNTIPIQNHLISRLYHHIFIYNLCEYNVTKIMMHKLAMIQKSMK